MLRAAKVLCICLMVLLLAQPVLAETAPSTAPEPDIVTAIYPVESLPKSTAPLSAPDWLRTLTTAPLYAMTEDGWLPVLAAALPEDVTADFVGSYGIPENAQRGYAFRISLCADACREDGTPITARDCIDSIITSLETKETAENWLFLAGAEAITSKKSHPGNEIISLRDAGFPGISEAWGAGYTDFYVDVDGFWGLDSGWRSVSDRTRLRDFAMPGGLDESFISAAYLYSNYLMDGAQSSYYQSEFIGICRTPGDPYTMEDLGLIEETDRSMILILQQPATASTLMQHLQPLILTGKQSYGPYRVASVSDSALLMEPNPNWWGEEDLRGYDRILCQKIGS